MFANEKRWRVQNELQVCFESHFYYHIYSIDWCIQCSKIQNEPDKGGFRGHNCENHFWRDFAVRLLHLLRLLRDSNASLQIVTIFTVLHILTCALTFPASNEGSAAQKRHRNITETSQKYRRNITETSQKQRWFRQTTPKVQKQVFQRFSLERFQSRLGDSRSVTLRDVNSGFRYNVVPKS